MSDILIPGPCVMCGMCRVLRTLRDGMVGDGICEVCDKLRFQQLHPRAVWVPWLEKRAVSPGGQRVVGARVGSRASVSPAGQAASGERRTAALQRAS